MILNSKSQGMRNGQTAKTATGAILEKTFAEDTKRRRAPFDSQKPFAEDTAKVGDNDVADTVSATTSGR